MMIIKDEEHYFFIPNSGLNIICEREYKHDLINDLYSYFNQKKKNKCVVLDDDNNVISNKDVEFIFKQNLKLKCYFIKKLQKV